MQDINLQQILNHMCDTVFVIGQGDSISDRFDIFPRIAHRYTFPAPPASICHLNCHLQPRFLRSEYSAVPRASPAPALGSFAGRKLKVMLSRTDKRQIFSMLISFPACLKLLFEERKTENIIKVDLLISLKQLLKRANVSEAGLAVLHLGRLHKDRKICFRIRASESVQFNLKKLSAVLRRVNG